MVKTLRGIRQCVGIRITIKWQPTTSSPPSSLTHLQPRTTVLSQLTTAEYPHVVVVIPTSYYEGGRPYAVLPPRSSSTLLLYVRLDIYDSGKADHCLTGRANSRQAQFHMPSIIWSRWCNPAVGHCRTCHDALRCSCCYQQ